MRMLSHNRFIGGHYHYCFSSQVARGAFDCLVVEDDERTIACNDPDDKAHTCRKVVGNSNILPFRQ